MFTASYTVLKFHLIIKTKQNTRVIWLHINFKLVKTYSGNNSSSTNIVYCICVIINKKNLMNLVCCTNVVPMLYCERVIKSMYGLL